jgi:hypothetical protein
MAYKSLVRRGWQYVRFRGGAQLSWTKEKGRTANTCNSVYISEVFAAIRPAAPGPKAACWQDIRMRLRGSLWYGFLSQPQKSGIVSPEFDLAKGSNKRRFPQASHATILRIKSGSSCRWLCVIPSLGTITEYSGSGQLRICRRRPAHKRRPASEAALSDFLTRG